MPVTSPGSFSWPSQRGQRLSVPSSAVRQGRWVQESSSMCVCSFVPVFCQWLCEYVCESEITGWFYFKCWLEVNVIQSNTFKLPDLAMLSDLLKCWEVSVSDSHCVLLSAGNECEKMCLFASTWTTHTVYVLPHGKVKHKCDDFIISIKTTSMWIHTFLIKTILSDSYTAILL